MSGTKKQFFFTIKESIIEIVEDGYYDYKYNILISFYKIGNNGVEFNNKIASGILKGLYNLFDTDYYTYIVVDKAKRMVSNIINNDYKIDGYVIDYLKTNYFSLLENGYNIEEVLNIIRNEAKNEYDYITTVLRLIGKNNEVKNYIFNSGIILFNKEKLSKYWNILLEYNFFEKPINELSFIENIKDINYSEILDLIIFINNTGTILLDDFINFNIK